MVKDRRVTGFGVWKEESRCCILYARFLDEMVGRRFCFGTKRLQWLVAGNACFRKVTLKQFWIYLFRMGITVHNKKHFEVLSIGVIVDIAIWVCD